MDKRYKNTSHANCVCSNISELNLFWCLFGYIEKTNAKKILKNPKNIHWSVIKNSPNKCFDKLKALALMSRNKCK